MRKGLKRPAGLADQISMNTVTTASMPSRIVSPARPGGAQPSPVESHLSSGPAMSAAPEQRALAFPRAAAQRGRGLHGQLVQQLGQMIVAGELGADRPLVPEEIGQRFEVSRTVVRESLRVLEAKGLVSARPNVGTRIRPVHEWNLLDPDVIEWRALGPLRTQQARELVELRLSFEPLAARLVAGRHTELPEGVRARLAELAEILAEASTVGDLPGYHRADAELHALLLRATDNRMLEHLACVVFGALEITGVRPYGCAFGAEQDPHAVLVAEVLKGDGAAAADCVSRLLCGLTDEAGQIGAGLHVPAQRDR